VTELVNLIQRWTGLSSEAQGKLLGSLIAVAAIYVLRMLLLELVFRRSEDSRHRYQWQKTSSYFAFGLALFILGPIWFDGFGSLSTFFGLLAAGIAVALKDPLTNLAGWAFLMWRRPFSVGDRIQIGEYLGDVIDVRVFQFTLMEVGNWVDADQSTGRVIHIPNAKVFSEAQANASRGFHYIWHEIPVLITFESNWRKAKDALQQIANTHTPHLSKEAEARVKEASKQFLIFYDKLTPTIYTSVRDSGVLLTIRYLSGPRGRRESEQILWEAILDAFAGHSDIDLAYPTQRFYDNAQEGKAPWRPSE
jgi:small-conductance mechanosensitive channel